MRMKEMLVVGNAMAVLLFCSASLVVAETETVSTIASLYHTPQEQRSLDGIELMPGVTMGVLVEVEAGYEKQGDDASSDIALATFELGIDAELAEGVNGHVLLLWEEDDTEPLDLDEAFITLGNTESMPVYVSAGKMYVPFGALHSSFVSDPLVLELGETRESAIMFGYENGVIQLSVGVFNGDMDDSSEDHADDLVAAINIIPADRIELGVYWMSDLGESDGLEGTLMESIEASEGDEETEVIAYDAVAGYGVYAHYEGKKISLDVEYMAADGDFDAGLLGDEAVAPAAWNAELAFAPTDSIVVAVRYEGSDDFTDMPENQYGVCGAYGFAEKMVVALEYLRGEFADGGDDRDLVTAQLGMEF